MDCWGVAYVVKKFASFEGQLMGVAHKQTCTQPTTRPAG